MKKRSSNTPARSHAGRAAAPPGRVRIIGGRYRRTPIPVAAAPGLRPTPDRVRETLFNWLEHLLGDLCATRVLDLFAGTGALGIEMASRGASQVLLVENNPAATAALRALVARLEASTVRICHADWRTVISTLSPASFDLIFLDPPFDSGLLEPALAATRQLLAPEGLMYVESGSALDGTAIAKNGLEIVRTGKAGVVYYHLLRLQAC